MPTDEQRTDTDPGLRRNLLVLLLFAAAFAALSTRSGPDASWDLRNYHLYNPFAVLHGKLGFDIAPAMRQTYNAPQLDLLYYGLRSLLDQNTTVLDAILGLPQAVGAFLTWRIARLFIAPAVPARDALAVLMAGLGATGACALPTYTGAGSEMIPGCFCLLGLLLLMAPGQRGRCPHWAHMIGVGALFGAAAALKLTTAPYGAGAFAAMLASRSGRWREPGLRGCAAFAGGLAGGLVVIAAPWWLTLEHLFGSPLFPYFNDVFRSPLLDPVALSDDRFRPAGLLQAVFFPFTWAVHANPTSSEAVLRDPRFAFAYAATIIVAIRAVRRRATPAARGLCRGLVGGMGMAVRDPALPLTARIPDAGDRAGGGAGRRTALAALGSLGPVRRHRRSADRVPGMGSRPSEWPGGAGDPAPACAGRYCAAARHRRWPMSRRSRRPPYASSALPTTSSNPGGTPASRGRPSRPYAMHPANSGDSTTRVTCRGSGMPSSSSSTCIAPAGVGRSPPTSMSRCSSAAWRAMPCGTEPANMGRERGEPGGNRIHDPKIKSHARKLLKSSCPQSNFSEYSVRTGIFRAVP